MKVVYLAHPLSGPDIERNRANAARWVAWATVVHRVAVVADWITLSGQLSEAEGREFGLECDKALIERCDEIWLCGGRVSPGMQIEIDHAIKRGLVINDLTSMGYEAPPLPSEAVDAR